MTTPATPPFAYGHDGALLVTADGPEILVHSGADEAPRWRHEMDAAVVGVGVTGGAVVAVDTTGTLVACDRETGDVLGTFALDRLASDLAASSTGGVAVLGASSVVCLRVEGDEARVEVDAPGATAVALDGEGKRVAVGDADGTVRVHDTTSGKERGSTRLGAPVKSLCWSPRGHWIAATGQGLVRVDAGGSASRGLVDTKDLDLGPVACSEDGAICAVRVGTSKVGLFDLHDFKFQGMVQYERTVGRIAFGPSAWLGIGLDEGDGNKVDLLTGTVHRTDPHEGRKRNRWELIADPRTQQIAAVMERARKEGEPGGKKRKTEPARPSPTPADGAVSGWMLAAAVVLALGVLAKLLL